MAAPIINPDPMDAATDVAVTNPLRIQCLPVGLGVNNDIDPATLNASVTVDAVVTNIIVAGVIDPGFSGAIAGAVDDRTSGISWGGVLPVAGEWYTGKTYTVIASVDSVGGVTASSTSTFSTASTLTVTVYPLGIAEDVPTRNPIQVKCIDTNPTANGGVDPLSLNVSLTVGALTLDAVKLGIFQPGFAGAITGDPTDPVEGVTVKILPLGGRWLPNSTYTVTASASTVNAIPVTPITTTEVSIFMTDSHTVYEDMLAATVALENTLIAGGFTTNVEQLRSFVMRAVTDSGANAVRARTVLSFCNSTDMGGFLKNWVVLNDLNMALCDRRNPLVVYHDLERFIPRIDQFLNELTWLSQVSRDLIKKRVNHTDPLYVVSAFATLVALGAVGKQEGY